MSKKIKLTWVNDGETFVEDCKLVSENDPCIIVYRSGKVEKNHTIIQNAMKNGLVLFEDDTGIFALFPEQVIHIEEGV